MSGGSADLRQPLLGAAAWLGGLSGLLLPRVWVIAAAAAFALVITVSARSGAPGLMRGIIACGWVFVVVAGLAMVRMEQVHGNAVAALGQRGAAVEVTMTLTGDPRLSSGRFSDYVTISARIQRVEANGVTREVSAPVLVIGDASWAQRHLGERVLASGRLSPSDDRTLTAVMHARGSADLRSEPAWWWRSADRVRASLRASVAQRPDSQRALVPALVLGDDSAVDVGLADDFRTTGLTHLMAVSGTNLTLLVGFLLLAARWLGVRGRWHYLVGGVGIVGFVVMARPEPSVLRAAVMGAVGLVALGPGGRHAGGRALGVAVTVLLLVDPWLAISPGFTLSVLATGGIVFLGPGWRDALARWLPRWLAEAIAVPVAAQLACTPMIAALSGRVSLVAIGSNVLAAPAVGPATVLGLGGAMAGLVAPRLGTWLGTVAGWCVAWIAAVARHGAALPTPDIGWGSGAGALALLTLACGLLAWRGPRIARRPGLAAVITLVLVVVMLLPPGTPGWPPDGWVLTVCDVGQGDALVLRAAVDAAVVVDTGPDPRLVDRCLRRLRIREVPLVVLTHFHADHVGGLAGVLRGREVHEAIVTTLLDPPENVTAVSRTLAEARVAVRPVGPFEHDTVGAVDLRVVWPNDAELSSGPGDGSTANNASIVLLVHVHGVSLLLTGDVEPEGQAALWKALPGLRVDVLKVPHHGSRYQDLEFLTGLGARVAITSVGIDNDYGHPDPATLAALAQAGGRVLRTDHDGDVVVVERDGRLLTFTSR